jgi:RNA polymerase sigma factor (TIGR02999 family)
VTSVTELLAAHQAGQPDAFGQLVDLVYQDLRRIARGQRRRAGGGDTLNTTALVHEAYARLVEHTGAPLADRGHLLAVAAVAMRQLLVDHARRRSRDKRGGGAVHASLDEMDERIGHDAQHILALDLALDRLAAREPRQARIVECRYFAGLTEQETADALGLSLRTVQREWLKARAWLRVELGR